ncbi:argininosuccinate synthase [Candidatus Woesearchaeota archaeon]|nr:argininosuccinate synthase [Candidatus Woesearchaeota archaeon]
MKQKVILAFSGGLDTSFCTLYLKEKGFDVITATIDTGGLSSEELKKIEARSKELGAVKHICTDAKKEIFDEIISNLIKANGLYQGIYPNMCADRYTIAKHAAKIAKKENAEYVSHGCTGAGNDQVRIDATINTLTSGLKILAPIRELMITRPEEVKHLESKGFQVDKRVKRYTINTNIFGVTVSGSEIDEGKEPSKDAWQLSKITKAEPEYFTIGFEKGVPVSLNGKKMHGSDILVQLNQTVGGHGYGRGIYYEDETIGIKGIQAFEAPGLMLLIEAHRALERAVLTRRQQKMKAALESEWADLAYNGLLYEPLMRDIEAFVDKSQEFVSGTVTMKVGSKSAMPTEIKTEYSLVAKEIASYAQGGTWKGKEAEAFIKFYGMQQMIASKKRAK